MRTRTAPENTILSAAHRWHNVKIEVKDAAGAWVDRSAYVIGTTWGADVDQPIAEARIRFRRDSGANSLSPIRGDSPLNVGGAAIDAGREIRISPATSAHGVAPVAGDYKQLFLGSTDSVDFANSTMEVVARDQGGALVDAWIEAATPYGSGGGTALETVIQDILDDWAPGVTLYVPVSPGFNVLTYEQGKASVFEALRTLAGMPGWDIRYLWDNGTSAFRLTLFEPDRTKTVPDWTFAGNRYFDVTQLAISRELVRNYIVVTFTNVATGLRQSVFATDATSVARFGRRWMEIEEAADSAIDTAAEAQALADAALADLAWPIAEQVIELPFFWPVDTGDLIRFTANTVHTDGDLDLAVTGYEHELAPKRERTRISVRGKPAGFYKDWIRRGKTPPAAVLIAPTLEIATETENPTLGTFGVTVLDPSGVATDLYYSTKTGPAAWNTWVLKTATPTDGVTYTESVSTIEDHLSFVGFRLDYVLAGEALSTTLESSGFDKGKFPLIEILPHLTETGAASASVNGDFDTASIKIAASVSALPSDATVRAATAINGRNFSPALIGVLLTAAIGQTVYIKAFGYSGTGGIGNESSTAAVAQVTRTNAHAPKVSENVVRSSGSATLTLTIDDPLLKIIAVEFNKRSGDGALSGWISTWDTSTGTPGVNAALTRAEAVTVTGGKDSEISWRVTFTDENVVSKTIGNTVPISNLDAVTKTMVIPAHNFVPAYDTTEWDFTSARLSNGFNAALSEFFAPLDALPQGVTITNLEARMLRTASAAGNDAIVQLENVNDSGTVSVVVTLTHATTGAATYSASVSSGDGLTTGKRWLLYLKLDSVTPNLSQLEWVKVTYTMPDFTKAT